MSAQPAAQSVSPTYPRLVVVNPSEPRRGLFRALHLRSVRWAALLVLCAAAGVTAIAMRSHSPVIRRGALAPDAEAVRYRYSIAPVAGEFSDDAAEDLVTLEQRVRTVAPSPFDLSELADLYLRRAKRSGDGKDYAASEAMAQRSLQILPSPNGAVLVLAQLANTRHQFREAIALALRHQRGRSSGAYTVLATAHLALGELGPAGAAAEALVAARPSSAAYLLRALVMQAQGRDEEAGFDFARAAAAEEAGNPQEAARLRSLWGRFLLRRGELVGADAVLSEALRIVPGFPLALAQRGELALRTGDFAHAEDQFEQAFATSRQVRYLMDQARALEMLEQRASADALRVEVERLIRAELAEGGLGHRLDLVEVLLDREVATELPEAVKLARDELARRPSAEVRFQLARALARSGASDEANELVQAALASGARDAQFYELAAILEKQRGNAARSAMYHRLAQQLDPGNSGWRTAGISVR